MFLPRKSGTVFELSMSRADLSAFAEQGNFMLDGLKEEGDDMKKHLQPLTPAALYARVSSDRQDVDLSVAAQLRALKEYAEANGYSVAREYIDEAESGRIADRPQFKMMIEEGSKPKAPFQVILVWKFSRFTRKREHAVVFKSQLRRKGIRVVSITEQAEDNATGRLLEGIIETVDEFYSENLATEVVRGMREAASRGFFLGSKAPFGYKKIKVQDGAKERPSLEVDPVTAPVVREIFEKSLMGNGLKELCKELNDRGVTNRGKRWYKGGLHYVLRNEAYTGAAVWGRTSKGEKGADPVRVEGAWPALVSKELFEEVQQAMSERAPKVQKPGRVGSQYLLSGLLKCGVCGRPYSAQGAKSGQFAYYICGTLFREGAGTCSARYLNAPKLETFVVEKIRERILNEETIVALVQLVAEEIDAMAGELADRLEVVEAELEDVRKRLGKLYEAIETSELTLEVLSPRIMSLRHREEQLEAARDDAETRLEQRRVVLPETEEIVEYAADFRAFLKDGTIPEKKVLIRNFVEGIEVDGDEATLTYTVPMPSDGVTRESASVLDFVQSSPPVKRVFPKVFLGT
ncbi:MAG: recombinase family protein [Dehalococcoidia bacterium]|nr:recombinase family protein [Dehalococcoidia bacterium]